MTHNAGEIAAQQQEVATAVEACAVSLQTTHRLLSDLVATSTEIDSALLVKIFSARQAAAEALQALGIFVV